MPNQNPYDTSGANAMGRWDYGPWFWPPFTGLIHGAVPNPYCNPDPATGNCTAPGEPPVNPGTPNPSGTPESFMDTMVVNGTAYPTMTVPAGPVRFRILSVGNDRSSTFRCLWPPARMARPRLALLALRPFAQIMQR